MKRAYSYILLSLVLISTLSATDVSTTVSDINAFGMKEGRLGIKFSYDVINSSIDIFNVKEKENSEINKNVSMGDANGFDIGLGYGLTSNISLYYNLQYLTVDYIDDDLKNIQNDIYVRLKFYDNPNYVFDAFSLDLGFIRNSADDMVISNPTTVNSMFNKLRPNNNFYTDNGNLTYDNKTVNDISPSLKMSDLSDNSLYFRFILGTKIGRHLFNTHLGFKYSDISNSILLEPSSNPKLSDAIKAFGDTSMDRQEKALFTGIGYIGEWGSYILESSYEYIRIFDREDELSDYNSNHIINASLSKALNDNLLIFIGAKMMFNQFNGVIPYLYNKFSQSKYDKNYGYARLGFVYNFDLFDKTNDTYESTDKTINQIKYINSLDTNPQKPIIYVSSEKNIEKTDHQIENEYIQTQQNTEPIIYESIEELKNSIPNEVIEKPKNYIYNNPIGGDKILEQRICSPIMPCN